MDENIKRADKYGILAQARKLLPKLKHDHFVERKDYKETLAKIDADYETVLKEMLGFIRNAVNGNGIENADDLLEAFCDSVYGIGALMMRAENIAVPMLKAVKTERAAFKEAIIRGKDIMLDELDDLLSCEPIGYPYGYDGNANDLAYEAYDIYNGIGSADDELLAALPVIQYLEKNEMKYYFWGILDNSCARAVVDYVPVWSKRHPLLGYIDKEVDDGVERAPNRFGLDSINFDDHVCRKVKVNTDFTDIFASKLAGMYKNTDTGTVNYMLTYEFKRITHKHAMSIFAEDNRYATAKIYASVIGLLDKIDKDGMTFTAESYDEGLPLVNAVTQYCTEFKDDKYIVNKNGLNLFVEINEALELTGMIPGFDIIAGRIRNLQ